MHQLSHIYRCRCFHFMHTSSLLISKIERNDEKDWLKWNSYPMHAKMSSSSGNTIDAWILFGKVLPLSLKISSVIFQLYWNHFSLPFKVSFWENKRQTFKWINPQSQKWKCCCTAGSRKESAPVIANREICRCHFNWEENSWITESSRRRILVIKTFNHFPLSSSSVTLYHEGK